MKGFWQQSFVTRSRAWQTSHIIVHIVDAGDTGLLGLCPSCLPVVSVNRGVPMFQGDFLDMEIGISYNF